MSMVEMDELLQLVVDENASDLHVAVGKPPCLRIDGRLRPLESDPLVPEDTERLMRSITSEEHIQRVREHGGTDFGFAFGDMGRFRVSVFRQKGFFGVVLRLIPSKLLTFEEIGLPPGMKDILFRPRGLILVVGPTGSGKTTTLATMVNIINTERDCHIITIEDPIEYYHSHKKSVVTQRELGVDVPSFAEALKRGLRQDPDVMLVGEMRDLETMEAAITAAETGHLVFATLHTTGSARTVDRIIDAFPTKPSIQNLIREAKTYRITSDIQTGAKYGMKTLDASLLELYRKGMITYGDLLTKAQDPESLIAKLKLESA
jgi:twitching motility protein PilT